MECKLRDLVRQRANGRWEYCQLAEGQIELLFEVDHIIAEKHRGPTRAGNLCFACFACNNHKGLNISGIDEITKKIVPLFNPRRHKWSRHFRWEGPVLVGPTQSGGEVRFLCGQIGGPINPSIHTYSSIFWTK